jgi:hypothetical protein
MNAIKYVILLTPVNRYLLSLAGSAVYSVVGSVMKKTLIYTARTAYTTIVNKK